MSGIDQSILDMLKAVDERIEVYHKQKLLKQ